MYPLPKPSHPILSSYSPYANLPPLHQHWLTCSNRQPALWQDMWVCSGLLTVFWKHVPRLCFMTTAVSVGRTLVLPAVQTIRFGLPILLQHIYVTSVFYIGRHSNITLGVCPNPSYNLYWKCPRKAIPYIFSPYGNILLDYNQVILCWLFVPIFVWLAWLCPKSLSISKE